MTWYFEHHVALQNFRYLAIISKSIQSAQGRESACAGVCQTTYMGQDERLLGDIWNPTVQDSSMILEGFWFSRVPLKTQGALSVDHKLISGLAANPRWGGKGLFHPLHRYRDHSHWGDVTSDSGILGGQRSVCLISSPSYGVRLGGGSQWSNSLNR